MNHNLDTAIQAIQDKNLVQAEKILNDFEEVMKDDAQFWSIKAMLYIQKNDFQSAVIFLQQAIDLDSKDIQHYYNKAICHKVLNQYTQADNTLKSALVIAPNNATIKAMFNTIFDMPESDKKLIDAYVAQVFDEEQDQNLLYDLALNYSRKFSLHKAMHFYKKLVSQSPTNNLYLTNFTQAVSACKMYADGVDFLQGLQQSAQGLQNMNVFISFLKLRQKTWVDYESNLNIIKQDTESCLLAPNKIANIPPFHTLFFIKDKKLILEVAKRISQYNPPFKFEHQAVPGNANKKLRIGFVSSDFRNHPVAHLCRNLFHYLNKNNIETYLYATSNNDDSEYRKYIKASATCFKNISALSIEEVATLINQDNIDIAVDMQGLTANIVVALFSYRPAPIQIAYLGYPSTTGANYIDYIIVDKVIIPIEEQQYFSETFIYMPHCYQVNDDEQKISTEILTKNQYGLPEDQFVYCSFNNTYKIEPNIFTVWMSILNTVPNSVLWLLSATPEDDAALRAHAIEQGVSGDRIIFASRESKDKHLRRLQLADLFLDTYIVGAHTTASDSLWAGVPILTCTGDRFVSRVCTSLLVTQGLTELVTQDLTEYQQKAIDYAQHPDQIVALKQKIKDANKTRPLFKTEVYANDLAKAFRLVWQRYCEGASLDIIEVT